MDNAQQVYYLGDELDKTGKAKATIEKRRPKGFGIAADILSITDDIPLGR